MNPMIKSQDWSTHSEKKSAPSKYTGNKPSWTMASDDKDDRKNGIKEDSKQDKALDKKRGVK